MRESELKREARMTWPYGGPWVLTGNTAKIRVLHDLERRICAGPPPVILDIGCVGPTPFNLWEPLLATYAGRFQLVGIDVAGIDQAQRISRAHGWDVELRVANAYQLPDLFAARSVDVVVATQVLEHVAHLEPVMAGVAHVLRPGGEAFFTVDSAHWEPRFPLRDPGKLLKNLGKKALSLVGHERYYDLPWRDEEIARACRQAGLTVCALRHYNLGPLKSLHNQAVAPEAKNSVMALWFDLEEALNATGAAAGSKALFRAIYMRAAR
jgi:2-polyprenyl-3-methyl-5-hydroxy-6-metoxy-1,4-benzoquinol methylase